MGWAVSPNAVLGSRGSVQNGKPAPLNSRSTDVRHTPKKQLMTHKIALAAAFSVVFAAGLVASSANAAEEGDAPKPCVATSFKISKVGATCKSGGQPAVKKMMKAAVKKAKAAGVTEGMKCKDCHEDLKTYTLKGTDPVGAIKKWL